MIDLLYIYLLMLITFAAAFVTVPLIDSGGPDSDADLLNTSAVIKGIFGMTVILVVWLDVTMQSKKALKILNKIVNMDKELLVVHDLCYLGATRQISILFSANCTVWISIFVLEILSVDNWYEIWAPLLLPSMIMNWFVVQYIVLLIMIENRAIGVNRGFLMISKGRLGTFIYSTTDVSERKIVNNFMILRRAHAHLSGICRDVAEYYSFPILPTIAFLCAATIYDSYYIIVPFVVNSGQQPLIDKLNMMCWLLMELSPVVVLAIYITRVMNQVC